MDHLAVHKSDRAWDVYKELNILPLFSPIYSPEYNPIEMMFSKLKNIVKRMRLKDMLEQRKRTFDQLIDKAVMEIEIDDVDNYIAYVMRLFKLR